MTTLAALLREKLPAKGGRADGLPTVREGGVVYRQVGLERTSRQQPGPALQKVGVGKGPLAGAREKGGNGEGPTAT